MGSWGVKVQSVLSSQLDVNFSCSCGPAERFLCKRMTRDWMKEHGADLEVVILTMSTTSLWHSLVSHEIIRRHKKLKKLNSMFWVRERTIPTERPPLVGEVIANFCGKRVPRGRRDGYLRPYSRISRQETLLFYQVAPQLYSRGWVVPVPDPLLFFGSAGSRTRAPDL
jgi:hypothetical protein